MDLTIDNQRIHFSCDPKTFSKEKNSVLFLHDSLGCVELWRDFPKELASFANCNAIAYDRQGYGKSAPFTVNHRDNNYLQKEAEILGQILEKLNLNKVILFGHSDGGSIALLAAALFPEKILGIITEGAHVFVEKVTIRGIKEAKKAYNVTNLRERLTKYHGDKTDDVFRLWTETWLSSSYRSWNIEEYLPLVKCPSLIIQGEKDEYGTLDQVTSIVSKSTGKSTALLIKDVGHTPHKEIPELIIENSLKFINSVSS
ncbi:alpha/beta hydrolase [Aquimarina gracilis]|uniref:Alpha/beta hydrolase n=1 Tax=Aquimarina gracilis TaxID=874422 RepID=A0ABU5ZXX8_9FLAO|nr:alpha/beta hydrolase [Aquimarina gracilis]MEB3346715.1 alpha/beta hydrolase [Aquimarina gracilis]